MGLFDKLASGPIEQAHKAADEVVDRIEPITHTVEMRLAGILDTLLDRIGKAKITVTIDIPKAGEDWEKTKP